jgi:hypothetical protein
MRRTMPEDDAYRAAHLQAALAVDDRVQEPELEVLVSAGRAQVRGVVPTVQRQEAIHEIIEELAPDLEVDNLTTVADYGRDPSIERMG